MANLTVKPPQDIMQPPSCRPNPPSRCRTEPEPVQGRRQKKAALLFLIPSQQKKSSRNPRRNPVKDWRLSQSRAVCPAEAVNEDGSRCSMALPVFGFQEGPTVRHPQWEHPSPAQLQGHLVAVGWCSMCPCE